MLAVNKTAVRVLIKAQLQKGTKLATANGSINHEKEVRSMKR